MTATCHRSTARGWATPYLISEKLSSILAASGSAVKISRSRHIIPGWKILRSQKWLGTRKAGGSSKEGSLSSRQGKFTSQVSLCRSEDWRQIATLPAWMHKLKICQQWQYRSKSPSSCPQEKYQNWLWKVEIFYLCRSPMAAATEVWTISWSTLCSTKSSTKTAAERCARWPTLSKTWFPGIKNWLATLSRDSLFQ